MQTPSTARQRVRARSKQWSAAVADNKVTAVRSTIDDHVDDDPATVLKRARDAARGKDVGLGGGATTIREFLDLVDTMHVAVPPVQLESGVRLWESPDQLLDRFHLEVVPSPSGVTHHLFWRR
jgi:dihydrofolate reductase